MAHWTDLPEEDRERIAELVELYDKSSMAVHATVVSDGLHVVSNSGSTRIEFPLSYVDFKVEKQIPEAFFYTLYAYAFNVRVLEKIAVLLGNKIDQELWDLSADAFGRALLDIGDAWGAEQPLQGTEISTQELLV